MAETAEFRNRQLERIADALEIIAGTAPTADNPSPHFFKINDPVVVIAPYSTYWRERGHINGVESDSSGLHRYRVYLPGPGITQVFTEVALQLSPPPTPSEETHGG